MKTKVLFLDIDGTLVDFQGKIPESAKEALIRAKERGHHPVLCTGRTRFQVYPWLLDYGFDGLITGAGAQVEAGRELICRHLVKQDSLAKAVAFFERIRAPYYLQAEKAIYAPQWCIDCQTAVFHGELSEEERQKRFGRITRDEKPCQRKDVEKLAYYHSVKDLGEVRRALGDYFTVEASSFQLINSSDGEVTVRGIDKAYGMEQYLRYAGIRREDSAAFGDGPNDLGMLEYAGTGVAMGNAGAELKSRADLVTSSIGEDGLLRAFEALKLI